jgi:hypothetical protein
MTRFFHPSPQLFRIPEDTDADEEDGEEAAEGADEEVCCTLVWVAILRDTCVLVDIGEEEVPAVVINTAQGLLWDTSAPEKQVGWVEYCCDDDDDDDDDDAGVWKGLRYNQPPWSFACVYNAQQISLIQCRRWIMDQVRWTASMREVDPLWLTGGYHACQTLFAPLLQDRLQHAGVHVSTRAAGRPFGQSDELPDLESRQDSPLEDISKHLFRDESSRGTDGTLQNEFSEPWEYRSVNISVKDRFIIENGFVDKEKETKGVSLGRDDQLAATSQTSRQQPHQSPNKRYPAIRQAVSSSPYKEKTTEELVKRLARKQAELDRQRRDELELRTSPRKSSPNKAPRPATLDTCEIPQLTTTTTTKLGLDLVTDADSGSSTSATADDEEFGGPLLLMDHEPRDAVKPCQCWFLPSLPRSKGSAIIGA